MKRLKKMMVAFMLIFACTTMLASVTSCSNNLYIHDNRCFSRTDFSNCTTGTRMFVTSNGTERFHCRSCAERCSFCGGTATDYRTNLLDFLLFLCTDCLESR